MWENIWEKLQKLSRDANVFGVNFPTAKDPKTQTGSVSLTILLVSSTLVTVGLVQEWWGIPVKIDIENALEFFYASSALYFGRKWTSKSKSTVGGETASKVEKPNG